MGRGQRRCAGYVIDMDCTHPDDDEPGSEPTIRKFADRWWGNRFQGDLFDDNFFLSFVRAGEANRKGF